MDTSVQAWLEDRSDEEIDVITLIDDATSRPYCRFFPRDTGAANRQLLIDYVARYGRMRAVYADRVGHFQVNWRRTQRQERDQEEALTLIKRGLKALDIELIAALSPQAKGRVKRLFGTLQDRLIKEMRVRDIASLEEANRFLETEFIPFWNKRFTVTAQERVDAHRELPPGVDLLRLFAETKERVIGKDFTVRYLNRYYQIEERDADPAMPRTRVTIDQRLDGTLRFRWRERYLLPTPLPSPPPKPEAPTLPGPRPLSRAAANPKPAGPDHPWRRNPLVLGKRLTSPAPRATLSTPGGLETALHP